MRYKVSGSDYFYSATVKDCFLNDGKIDLVQSMAIGAGKKERKMLEERYIKNIIRGDLIKL